MAVWFTWHFCIFGVWSFRSGLNVLKAQKGIIDFYRALIKKNSAGIIKTVNLR